MDNSDVRLYVDLYYDPDADFLGTVSLPGELEITGLLQNMEVR